MSGIRMMTDCCRQWRMAILRKWLHCWVKREPVPPNKIARAKLRKYNLNLWKSNLRCVHHWHEWKAGDHPDSEVYFFIWCTVHSGELLSGSLFAFLLLKCHFRISKQFEVTWNRIAGYIWNILWQGILALRSFTAPARLHTPKGINLWAIFPHGH